MAIFTNHPLFGSLNQVRTNVSNMMVSNKQAVIDNSSFNNGSIQNGIYSSGDIYANDLSATPLDMIYTSEVLFVENIEEWVGIQLSYVGSVSLLEIRGSDDGSTFTAWKTVGLTEIFSMKKKYFQCRVTVPSGTTVGKIVIGFNENVPNLADFISKMTTSGGSEADYTVEYVYNTVTGNVIEERYTGGIIKIVRYGYDANNRINIVETELTEKVSRQLFNYDLNGNISKVDVRTERKNGDVFTSAISYTADAVRVLDEVATNNTIRLAVSTSTDVKVAESFKLDGIVMPDRYTDAGKIAWKALSDKLATGSVSVKPTLRDTSTGNWNARLVVGTEDINDWLVANGYATYKS